jgi:hypothetical protein
MCFREKALDAIEIRERIRHVAWISRGEHPGGKELAQGGLSYICRSAGEVGIGGRNPPAVFRSNTAVARGNFPIEMRLELPDAVRQTASHLPKAGDDLIGIGLCNPGGFWSGLPCQSQR